MHKDYYKTLTSPTVAERKEKGSRFIAYAAPAACREEAEAIVAHTAKKNFDATHNCFAYRIGVDKNAISKFNDDGEPAGTAGRPILQAIHSLDLTNVIVIVTRYFGGTKLGTGGLIRAYGGVASQALALAHIERQFLTDLIRFECSYHDQSSIQKIIQKFDGRVQDSNYGDDVKLSLTIRKSRTEQFIARIIDQTAGRVTPLIDEQSK